ncbi:MAG TPA: SH3 domain-containing protein [Coleofasciculaceae cyanobacterium]
MRYSISTLFIVTSIALAGCTAGNPRTDGIETLPSVPEERYTPTATPSFPGEAAHLIDETSNTPVTVRAEPSDQARSVATVAKEEVVQVVDSTRDEQQRMWYRIQHASGQEGWVMGQYMRFIGNPDPSARPSVVMPGEIPILAQPGNDARVVGRVRGGEVLTISRSVEVPELDNRKSTWLQTDRGWVSAEFMFQPACLRFDGNPMRVVSVEGAIVRTEPSSQAQEADRLEGGEIVVPLALETNEQGEWLKNEQGWVNSRTLFLPTCQSRDLQNG